MKKIEQRMEIRIAIIYHIISLTSIIIFIYFSLIFVVHFELEYDKTNGKMKGDYE